MLIKRTGSAQAVTALKRQCASQPANIQDWRLELFVKKPADVHRIVDVLRSNNIRRVNLPNKGNEDRLIEIACSLQESIANLDLCVHYSLKYNYNSKLQTCIQQFRSFCNELAETGAGMSVLLVSGGGKKRQHDTVVVLQEMAATKQHPTIPVYVAFNPYLPSAADFAKEKQRLRQKLATRLVSGIYLQMGTDLQRLEQGLAYMTSLLDELYPQHDVDLPVAASQMSSIVGTGGTACATPCSLPDASACGPADVPACLTSGGAHVLLSGTADAPPCGSDDASACGVAHVSTCHGRRPQLLGSVFKPSKQLLAQMKFRPWSGVYLSTEYLSGVEAANEVTRQLLRIYTTHGVVPLVETNVRTTEEMAQVHDMLNAGSAPDASSKPQTSMETSQADLRMSR